MNKEEQMKQERVEEIMDDLTEEGNRCIVHAALLDYEEEEE